MVVRIAEAVTHYAWIPANVKVSVRGRALLRSPLRRGRLRSTTARSPAAPRR